MFDFFFNFGNSSSAYYNELGELKFNPPVYEQRYCITARILEHDLFIGHIKKVIDFGCAELKLLEQLKRIPEIENIMEAFESLIPTESSVSHTNSLDRVIASRT